MKNTVNLHRNIIIASNERGEEKYCIEPLEGEIELKIAYENFMKEINDSLCSWQLKTVGSLTVTLGCSETTNQRGC